MGIKKQFRNDSVVNLIPDFRSETPQATYETLISLMDTQPKGFVGLCADFNGKHEFDYYIAAATTQTAPNGFVTYRVPAATWVILEWDGALMDLSARFWKEWLPSSGYRRADDSIPDAKVYQELNLPKPDYKYEL